MYYRCMPTHTNPYHTANVDVTSSTQNAFVQDWLSAYRDAYPQATTADEREAFEVVLEAVQDTYDYTKDENHGKR